MKVLEIENVHKIYELNELLKLLNQYRDKCTLIAGGTDVVIKLRDNKIKPIHLIDISDIDEMRFIKEDNEYIEIGALTTFTDIEKNAYFIDNLKGLSLAANSVGSPQIRNKGTVGGNICNGSPAADVVPPLLALNATAVIKSLYNSREIPLENIFIDKGTVDINFDEVLYSVKFKKLKHNEMLTFSKLGLRKALAITRISIAVYAKLKHNMEIDNIRIGSAALGKFCLRERKLEEFLNAKILNENIIEEAKREIYSVLNERLENRYSKCFKVEVSKGVLSEALTDILKCYKKSKAY